MNPAPEVVAARWWGDEVDYQEALLQQRELRSSIIAGEGRELIAGLTHKPTITTGRRSIGEAPSADSLREQGIVFIQSERGGLATYHGPGQLMIYLFIDIGGRGLGVRDFVCRLEGGIIDYFAHRGVTAARRKGAPGVWVDGEKIAAVGLNFSRGVSMHGAALYINRDNRGFDLITPCGIEGARATSLEEQLSSSFSPRGEFGVATEFISRSLFAPTRP